MKIFIIIFMPFVIILTVFQFVVFDKQWYIREFDKLGVYGKLDKERVNEEANNVFGYLRGRGELEKRFYTNKEVLHLADVKLLYKKMKWTNILFIVAFLTASFYIIKKKGKREFFKNIFLASIFSFGIFIILIISGSIFFDQLFYLFHKISFANNFWLLDPDTDFLVVIFSQQIFLDLVMRIFFVSIVISIILSLVIGLIRFKFK